MTRRVRSSTGSIRYGVPIGENAPWSDLNTEPVLTCRWCNEAMEAGQPRYEGPYYWHLDCVTEMLLALRQCVLIEGET